jgi:hypothetical protein
LSLAGNTALSGNKAGPSAAGLTGSGGGALLSDSAVLTCPAGASLAVSGNTAAYGAGVGAGGRRVQCRPAGPKPGLVRTSSVALQPPRFAQPVPSCRPTLLRHPPPASGTCGTPAGGGLALSLTAGAAPACAITVTNNTAFSAGGGGTTAGGGGILLRVPAGAVLDFQNGLQQVCAGEGGSHPKLVTSGVER